ncbi:4-hydroxy-tetrahydrodipicolinate synthase [Mycoplasmatota bacterium]|nr:4-hydroxy-tetrahydrodipicolinate synthase [Mycoplasmatota bacterium]
MFIGSFVAIVTPFKDDLTINYDELERLIEWQIDSKTDGIVVCGTTGEAATLSLEEKLELIQFIIKKVDKRVLVIAGTGTNCTKTSVDLSKKAEELGVDGLLVVNPYYNKGNNKGIFTHYKMINDAVNIPIILYNVPSRTGMDMSVELIKELSNLENIIAIKEASGDLKKFKQLVKKTDLIVLSGNDDIIVKSIRLGGKGVISVLSNVKPIIVREMVYYAMTGKEEIAEKLQRRYMPLVDALFIEVNPIPVKMIMNYLDHNVGGYRLPLAPMSKSLKRKVVKILFEKYGI